MSLVWIAAYSAFNRPAALTGAVLAFRRLALGLAVEFYQHGHSPRLRQMLPRWPVNTACARPW